VKLAKKTGFIVIPQGFGEAVSHRMQTGRGKIPLVLGYDKTQPGYGATLHGALNAAASAFFQVESPLAPEVKSIARAIKNPVMNWIAPSMIILGLMILIPTSAGRLVRDKQSGFLSRLLTTPTSAFNFIIGYSIPFIVVGITSVPLYLAIALLLGLEIVGSLPLAFLLYLIVAVICVGWGMIISSLARTSEQVDGLSWLMIIPLAAISGLWFSTEQMPSYMKLFASLFPFKYAAEASRDIINRAGGWEAIGADFLFLLLWAGLAFIGGIILFRRSMGR